MKAFHFISYAADFIFDTVSSAISEQPCLDLFCLRSMQSSVFFLKKEILAFC